MHSHGVKPAPELKTDAEAGNRRWGLVREGFLEVESSRADLEGSKEM